MTSSEQYLYSVAASNGAFRWSSYELFLSEASSPCVKEGLIYYANTYNAVCVDSLGNKVWSAAEQFGPSSPTINKNELYIKTYLFEPYGSKKSIISLNTKTGLENWRFEMDSTTGFRGNIFYTSDKIFITTRDSLVAVDANLKKRLWGFYTGTTLNNYASFSQACGNNKVIFVTGMNHKLYAIDVVTGLEIWSVKYREFVESFNATPVLVVNNATSIHPTISGMTQ